MICGQSLPIRTLEQPIIDLGQTNERASVCLSGGGKELQRVKKRTYKCMFEKDLGKKVDRDRGENKFPDRSTYLNCRKR